MGSGFLVGGTTVLTSAHVVQAGQLFVRRLAAQPGRQKTIWPARIRLIGDVDLADLALIEVVGDPGDHTPVGYARIDRNTPSVAVVRGCTVVGFPEFKRRGDMPDSVRETVQLDGEIPTSEELGSGLLSFRINQPQPRPLPSADEALGKTPWSGISGAAALVDGRLVGVVSEHHPRAGASALTLVPITSIDRMPDADLWWAALAVDPARLRLLPTPIPRRLGELPAAAEHYQTRSCLDRVTTALASAEPVVLTPEKASPGGVGMTQLAAGTARGLWESREIDLLVWIRADERDRVVKSYQEAAAAVDTGDFLGWLARTDRQWLIVFDELANPAELADLWPPLTPGGRVLVCARELYPARDEVPGERGKFCHIEVGPFLPGEAIAYVMASLGCDADQAAQLARTLRFQPVALGEATSYIRAHGLDCQQYLERFDERLRLLPRMLRGGSGQADVQRSAATIAWSLGVERRVGRGERGAVARTRYQMSSGPDGTQTMTLEVDGSFTQQILNTFFSPGGGLENG